MNTHSSLDIATGFVRPNLIQSVADHLRQHLTRPGANGLLPGERHIALALDVSRPVIREALAALEKEGLILRHHGRSTRRAPHAVLKEVSRDAVSRHHTCHAEAV